MHLDEFQALCSTTAVYPDAGKGTKEAVTYCALKLAGEAGEVAEKVGKYLYRLDEVPKGETVTDMIAKELGDTLWYVAREASELGLSLEDIARRMLLKLSDRAQRGVLKGSGDNR